MKKHFEIEKLYYADGTISNICNIIEVKEISHTTTTRIVIKSLISLDEAERYLKMKVFW